MPGKELAGILDAGLAFEKRLDEIAHDRCSAQQHAQNDRVNSVHALRCGARRNARTATLASVETTIAPTKSFPRFAGADARDHFVFADQRTDRIRAGIAELGDQR